MAAVTPPQHYELHFFKQSTQCLSRKFHNVFQEPWLQLLLIIFNPLLLGQREHKTQRKSIRQRTDLVIYGPLQDKETDTPEFYSH